MPDTSSHIASRLDDVVGSDPRITAEYVRLIDGPQPVILLGVVHDHPASTYRVDAVISALDPALVAVELPNLLVPVLRDSAVSSDVGGEMATAIAAAGDTPVVGIDVPGPRTLHALLAEITDQQPSVRTVMRTIISLGRIGLHTLAGVLTHLDIPGVPSFDDLEYDHEYDLPSDASPATQATHEQTHLEQSTALLRTFEPPAATRFLDTVRERHMARRLESRCHAGPTLAVVGYGHLDGLEEILRRRSERRACGPRQSLRTTSSSSIVSTFECLSS